jgi:hypothetical protein
MFVYAATHTPHTYPTFYLYDDVFDQFDWSIEPAQSFQSLMEDRARQLRAKYDYLILSFSGGSDSTTIFNVFKKLNILIDEIVIGYHEDPSLGHPKEMINWTIDNKYSQSTKITVFTRDGNPEYLNTIPDDYFTLPTSKYIGNCNYPFSERISNFLQDPRFNNLTPGIIFGAEKPRVLYRGGKWISTQLDKTFKWYMPQSDSCEFFYITPDAPLLAIKQAHILKNNIRRVVNPRSDYDVSAFASRTIDNVLTIETWCGRDHSVAPLSTRRQKLAISAEKIHIAAIINPELMSIYTPSPTFVIPESKAVVRYLNALKTMQTDTTVTDYMRRFNLLNDTVISVDDYNGIYNKFRDLGD